MLCSRGDPWTDCDCGFFAGSVQFFFDGFCTVPSCGGLFIHFFNQPRAGEPPPHGEEDLHRTRWPGAADPQASLPPSTASILAASEKAAAPPCSSHPRQPPPACRPAPPRLLPACSICSPRSPPTRPIHVRAAPPSRAPLWDSASTASGAGRVLLVLLVGPRRRGRACSPLSTSVRHRTTPPPPHAAVVAPSLPPLAVGRLPAPRFTRP
ncbi:hypothetical protein PAHAL_9G393900 [Panicum hallii]|uniref:Uncharacterized protein n=1 Tax=Panicum hallii TaxID=206008 RepID=A0A2T8I427_9POAL|nr:hypothetical protein PAHAL_9G393900 [Panicum hallii]